MDWKKLTNDVVAAASAAFASLRSEKPNEHFYVFSLYTDSDAWTILPSANSIEKYEAILRKTRETNEKQIAYSKWATAEWAYEAWGKKLFTGIYRELEDHRKSLPQSEKDDEAYKHSVHECMISALKQMDEDGVFAKGRETIVLYVSSSDGDEAFDLENQSVKRLNPKEIYLPFLKRYG